MTEDVKVDVEAVRAEAAARASKETAEMYRLAAKHQARDLADKFVGEGRSLAEFRGAVLDQIGNKPLDESRNRPDQERSSSLLSDECNRAMANPTDRKAQEAAAFEFEAAAAAAQRAGVDPQGLFVPADVLRSWNQAHPEHIR